VDPIFFESRSAWRAWLEANHTSAKEVFVGSYKKATGKQAMSWEDSVEEALCFGWIDGVRRSLDADSSVQRFTPRRRRSTWSLINVRKFRELEAAGQVSAAGRAAFDARTEDRTGIYSSEQAEIELPPEAIALLRASPQAWAFWEKSPKSYRKPATWWLISAKKPETRERRLEQLVEYSERGERVPPLRPRVANHEASS
jgi:uncharacterized protein YdeI (YjbR/CyaY-like superfamily)